MKRSALLRKLSTRLIQLDDTRPSLRQLAIAAGVTVPTLRHYFGDREDLVEAVLEEFFVHGERYLERGAEPDGALDRSIRAFLSRFAEVLVEGPKLGDMIAIAFLEGFYSRRLGPAALNYVIEPPLQAMEKRLAAHQARGELGDVDLRCAALMLLSPLVVSCMHQRQMFGDQVRPLNFDPVIDSAVSSFLKAYAVPAASSEPHQRLAAVWMARRDLTGAVDFAHLETYAAHDGDVIDEVLAIFREQAAMWIKLLNPAGPASVWRDGAHTLRGASLGVGAFALAQACAEAEQGADQAAGERAVLLSRVHDALDAALADIAAYAHERALRGLKGP